MGSTKIRLPIVTEQTWTELLTLQTRSQEAKLREIAQAVRPDDGITQVIKGVKPITVEEIDALLTPVLQEILTKSPKLKPEKDKGTPDSTHPYFN